MKGMDVIGGPWSYRKAIGSSSAYTIASSSTSGTVSTPYTSSGSHLYIDPAIGERPSDFPQHSVDMVLNLMFSKATWEETTKERIAEKKKEHIKGLVQEFFGDPWRNYNTDNGNLSVLERWLYLSDESREWHDYTYVLQSWMWALHRTMETFRFTRALFTGGASLGLHGICEEEEAAGTETETQSSTRDMFLFQRFAQEAMIKMLSSVDGILALISDPTKDLSVNINGVIYEEKLSALLHVHVALSKASSEISQNLFLVKKISRNLSSHSPTASAQLERKEDEMVCLLSDKEGKVREAIWSTMEETRNHILLSRESDDKSWWGKQTLRGSLVIHKVTWPVTSYIRFLHTNYTSVATIVSEAGTLGNHVTQNGESITLTSLTMEMVSLLEKKILKKSLSFPDQSCRFLYLIDNLYFIWERLHMLSVLISEPHMHDLHRKIEDYIHSYLQVSWAPVLSCLSYTRSICLWSFSPLPKFESEFWKTYNAQRLWKVRDPVLRTRLRRAIVKTVTPKYREYLEENNNVTPRITPEEMERMLQQLFKG